MRQRGKILQNEEGHRWIYGICALNAGWIRRHAKSQYILFIAFPLQQLVKYLAWIIRYAHIACLFISFML